MSRPVALATGSSRGIGLEAAVALTKESSSVAVSGSADNDELSTALEVTQAEGRLVMALAFDVAGLPRHDAHLAQIEKALKPLATLINNTCVGVMDRGDPLEASKESRDRCQIINAKAVFFLTQATARRLLSCKHDPACCHAIVNVTPANAVAVATPRAEYCASKAAAATVSKTWIVRLGPKNIAVYDGRSAPT